METLISEFLKAISNPTRLRIIELLKEKPMCVCDIWNALNEEQSSISKHLNELKKVGIVDSRRDGLRIVYSVNNPRIFEIIETTKEIIRKEIEKKAQIALKKGETL
jgi:ArsR family transcriptional regulator